MVGMFSKSYAFNQNLSLWVGKFNPNINLSNIAFSGMLGNNYDAFLNTLNTSTIAGRNIGTFDLYYCNASVARASLLTQKGWTFSDNGQGTPPQIISQPASGTICGYLGLRDNYYNITTSGTRLSYKFSNDDRNIFVTPTTLYVNDKTGFYNISVLGSCGLVVSNTITVSGCPPTSVESPTNHLKLSIYPNPVEGELVINSVNNGIVNVYNSIGVIVSTFEVNQGETRRQINLPSGFYTAYLDKNSIRFLVK